MLTEQLISLYCF